MKSYHLARTVHGSTLSALVHAWVLAGSRGAESVEHFRRALVSDVADIQGGTTAEGVHLGVMAGCVDLVQRCFAGLEIGQDTLWVNPRWPHRFERLSFAIQYRDQPLTVTVDGGFVCVASEPGRGPAIRVGCGAEQRELLPGGSVAFCATAGVEEDERVTPRAAR